MRVFRPTISTTIATMLVFPLLVSLGFWQLDRAAEKRALAAAYEASQRLPPVEIDGELASQKHRYQWVSATATGEFARKTILLDNRIRNRQVGYEVLTPFIANGATVLVNQGWVPAGPDRQLPPEISTSSEPQQISGKLGPAPTTGIAINEHSDNVEKMSDRILRVQQVDLQLIGQALDITLLDSVLYLDDEAPNGYLRQWMPPGFNPEKHEAYATQWFVMALIVGVLYVVLNLKPRAGHSN